MFYLNMSFKDASMNTLLVAITTRINAFSFWWH